MKKIFSMIALLLGLLHSPAYAAIMNCNQFAKDLKNLQSTSLNQQKTLASLNMQMDSTSKALNDFNKNCRGASQSNCHPGTYNMISLQKTSLSGQRQKVEGQMIETAAKQEEAQKNLQACKSIKVFKTSL